MATPDVWNHDALAADLARRLRNDGKAWTWLNATLGTWSGPRPDVMAFPRFRYDVPQIHAYEIKVQRSDLLSDLNSEKWRKYLEHCQSVTFAMPSGLATRDEIPAECGVMFRTKRGWRTERRPTNIGAACSTVAMAKLLTCHPTREPYPGLGKWEEDAEKRRCLERFRADAGERYGRALASLAADIADGKDPAATARERADEILADAKDTAERVLKDLEPVFAVLGLAPDTPYWTVAQRIREVAQELTRDGRVARAESALAAVRKALEAAETKVAA